MIRLIQRRLIIPRGDTGTFSIPVLTSSNMGDVSIFTIFNPLTHKKIAEKRMEISDGVLTVTFSHGDTVNLPAGQYVWDIKFYKNPVFAGEKLIDGEEIDSYYAAFSLPVCEIRETGDSLLMDDDTPQAKLAPDQIDLISAAITATQTAKEVAVNSAADAETSASAAATSAQAALESKDAALASQTSAATSESNAAESAAAAQVSATQAAQIAQQIHEEIPTKVSDLVDDSGHYTKPASGIPASDLEETYLTSFTEEDPTVPEWAKQPQKPTYTPQEVGALPDNTYIPSKTSDLVNDSDYAVDANYVHTDNNYTKAEKNKLEGIAAGAEVNVNADWTAESGDAYILNKPTNVSAFNNDAGYLTEHQDISGKANSADLAAVATSGSYEDLSDKPTIPEVPVQDVQIDGSSILNNGIADIPYADSANSGGIVRANDNFGIAYAGAGLLSINCADETKIKTGTNAFFPIVPYFQHSAAFYGLAKAAGDTTQSQSDNVVGTYTDEAKAAIQQMLDVPSTSDIPDVSIYATKADTVLETTLSRGRKEGTTVGVGSFAFGDNVEASGGRAIAFGKDTVASGANAIAEGSSTIASNQYTHAEGYTTTASGKCAHSEGRNTIASGAMSHAEGYYTQALGSYSHTQGYATVASASMSHVEGVYNIIDSYALDPEWVASTEYNIGDKVKITTVVDNETIVNGYICITANNDAEFTSSHWAKNTSMNYAHIVGNGTTSNNRSNAYALDWDGNGHYAGDVYVHANADSTGGTKLATVEDIPEAPVQDVQVNGVSILDEGVANVPVAIAGDDSGVPGVVRVLSTNILGITIRSWSGKPGFLTTVAPLENQIKSGVMTGPVISPGNQHSATFYGLAKAAGADMKDIANTTVGTYPDAQKEAIQSMLGVSDLIATAENNLVASKAYKVGEVFTANGKLYKATAAIAADAAIITDGANANCEETSVGEGFVKFTDYATSSTPGIVKLGNGITARNGNLMLANPTDNDYKTGGTNIKAVVPSQQHKATFYGLAKAAGDTTQSASDNAVGTYTDTAKAAIRSMIGATSPNVIAVQDEAPTDADTKIWLPETAETPVEVPTVAEMNAALATKVRDVQVNGTSIVQDGVANVPIAGNNAFGAVRVRDSINFGVKIDSGGSLDLRSATAEQIKNGRANWIAITPSVEHNAAFYGLAKAAGDTTQSASSNAVGTYTDNAKASIKAMLGIQDGSTGTVDVTGTTPTITAIENTRYVCGEVTSLSFTPPASGISIVRFTSGSTVTVLTIPSTVKFPEWFDPTSLETNTIYEICVTDGEFGAVMSWAL